MGKETKIAAVVAALGATASAQTCTLTAPTEAQSPGLMYWVETGPSMKLYTTVSHPRQMITTGQTAEIPVDSWFTPFCTKAGYMVDFGCVVKCEMDPENPGETRLNTMDYCGYELEHYLPEGETAWDPIKADWIPTDAQMWSTCKPYAEVKMNKDCDVDFTREDDYLGLGQSLKDIWAEVMAAWNSEAGLNQLFGSPAPVRLVGIPGSAKQTLTLPLFYPHNFANMINMGIGINTAGNDLEAKFNLGSFNLGVYQSFNPAFEYVDDPLGSTGDGKTFFPDQFKSKDIGIQGDPVNPGPFPPFLRGFQQPTFYNHTVSQLKAIWIGVTGIEYHPCDKDGDAKFLGIPKACWHIHQAGPHTVNGQMMPFYKPIQNNFQEIDFFGVCSYKQLHPGQGQYEYDYNFAVQASTGSADAEGLAAAFAAAGSPFPAEGGYGAALKLEHSRSWGLHICLDYREPGDPIPYFCTVGWQTTAGPNAALSDMMVLDPLGFIHNPVENEVDVCEAYTKGDCNLTNANWESGDVQYEPNKLWSPYAPEDPPTPAPVPAPAPPKKKKKKCSKKLKKKCKGKKKKSKKCKPCKKKGKGKKKKSKKNKKSKK